MGGRREVSIISHRPVTRRDLKQERSFLWECLNIFATGCSSRVKDFENVKRGLSSQIRVYKRILFIYFMDR